MLGKSLAKDSDQTWAHSETKQQVSASKQQPYPAARAMAYTAARCMAIGRCAVYASNQTQKAKPKC